MPGILPYVNFNPMTGASGPGEQWVMISRERGGNNRGEWDYFNGSIDPGESRKEAAAREGYEESCGLFGTIDQLSDKMMSVNGNGFLLNAEDLKSKKDIIDGCTPEEYLKRKKFSKYRDYCYQEKTEVKWVKLASLVDACRKKDHLLPEGNRELKIRGSLVSLVNKHRDKIFSTIDINKEKFKKIEHVKKIDLEAHIKPLKAEGKKQMEAIKTPHEIKVDRAEKTDAPKFIDFDSDAMDGQRKAFEKMIDLILKIMELANEIKAKSNSTNIDAEPLVKLLNSAIKKLDLLNEGDAAVREKAVI